MRRAARTARPLAIAMALLAAGVGCAGPATQLSAGVSRFETSVKFGSDVQPSVFPVPGVPLPPISPPSLTTTASSPTLPIEPPVVDVPQTCPVASPIAGFDLAVSSTIAKPPKPQTYVSRTNGTFTPRGGVARRYPTAVSTTIAAVTKPDPTTGIWSYQEVSRLGTTTTTTTYQFVPDTPASHTGAGSQPTSGLFVTGIVETQGKVTVTQFHPATPGLLLLQTPAVSGDEWYASGADPATGVTMSWTGRQHPNVKVDACGKLIQAIRVHVDGSISVSKDFGGTFGLCPNPNPNVPTCLNEQVNEDTGQDVGAHRNGPDYLVTYNADYDIAPQYGGLIVSSSQNSTTTPTNCPASSASCAQAAALDGASHLLTIIDSLPKAP